MPAVKDVESPSQAQVAARLARILPVIDQSVMRLKNMRDVIGSLIQQKKLPSTAASSMKSGLEQVAQDIQDLIEKLE